MRTIEIGLYRYSELSEGAQEAARLWLRVRFGVKGVYPKHEDEFIDALHGTLETSLYEFTINGEWWEGE